jgi:hypothetical protein
VPKLLTVYIEVMVVTMGRRLIRMLVLSSLFDESPRALDPLRDIRQLSVTRREFATTADDVRNAVNAS